MNKYITIILCLWINSMLAQSNQGTIVYKKDFLKNLSESNTSKKVKEINPEQFKKIQLIQQMSENLLKDIEFILLFNNNESTFKVKEGLKMENDALYGLALGPFGSGKYYSNIKEKKYYCQLDAYGDKFLIQNPIIVWELFNETKQIGKYICYKASTTKFTKGRKGIIKTPIIAWYTSDLPIPFGPIGYGGLPGLILELQTKNARFYVSNFELNLNKQIEIKKPTQGKKVTKQEFEEIGLKTMSNFKNGF